MLRILEHWEGSDLGRQRRGNEDSYYVRTPLFVVADGMGGAQAGEVASEMAVASFERGLPDGSPSEGLVELIEAANHAIHERSRSDADYAGMGTTVTAAYAGEDEVTIGHVGDSRAYVLRDGELIRLTRDHSLVDELIRQGRLTAEQAEAHPQRSVITRALGPEPRVQVDVDVFPARAGDVFLLCSDGLTGMVPEPRVQELLEAAPSLEQAGRALIAAANDAGGRDNITVVLFRLDDVEVGAARERSPEPARTDEDTSEYDADPVPAAAAAPAAAPPPRRRRVPTGLIVTLTLLTMLLAGFWLATRVVFFLGTDPGHGNAVAIYQGLPYELPLGVRLYTLHATSGVTIDQVPVARRATFTNHKLRSLDDAENLVNALEAGELEP
jgi:protein phosphatase